MVHALNKTIVQSLIVFAGKYRDELGHWQCLLIGLQEDAAGGIAFLTEMLVVMMTFDEEQTIVRDGLRDRNRRAKFTMVWMSKQKNVYNIRWNNYLDVWQRSNAIEHVVEPERLWHNLIAKLFLVQHQHLMQIDNHIAGTERIGHGFQLFRKDALRYFRR